MAIFERLRRLLRRRQEPPGEDHQGGQVDPPDRSEKTPPDVDAEALPGQDSPPRRSLAASPALPTPQDNEPRLPQEQKLLEILKDHGVTPDPDQLLQLIAEIRRAGREPAALDLLRRLNARFSVMTAVRFCLAELLYDLGQEGEALQMLEQLTTEPQYAVRAHFMLGDHHERELEPTRALQHYQAVLAVDFTYPKARRRADELRRRSSQPTAQSAPTLMGAEDLGPGSRFLLNRELGRGGGGTVYLALDRSLKREVAVKVLHPHVASQAGAREHLFCEARIATSLRHPQIVVIYDLDETLNLVVMEYCGGGALTGTIPLEPLPALGRLAEIADVLDTVHRSGVIHQDLKPSNLLLRRADRRSPLVLTDFGLAHAMDAGDQRQQAGGSLAYMAPEQRRGEGPAEPRADLYSCGVVLLEMLLGQVPLDHQQVIQGALLVEQDELWRQLAHDLPGPCQGLLELARQLVHPTPGQRPADASEVAARARALLSETYA